ncbi:MAG: M56 family metallopeptidase [Gemmatales bacterium]
MTILFDWLISNAVTASILALLALVVSYAWPRRPALAHACWLLVLLKLLTPPLYVFSLAMPENQANASSSEVSPSPPPARAKQSPFIAPVDEQALVEVAVAVPQPGWWERLVLDAAWSRLPESLPQPLIPEPVKTAEPAIVTPWYQSVVTWWATNQHTILISTQWSMICGSAMLFLITLYRIIRFENMLHLASPAPEPLQTMQKQIGQVMNLRKLPRLVVVPGKVGPLLWQRWNDPIIVLPVGLLEAMHEDELRTVLAHELTHYRRGDPFWRYLELAAVTLYWWLPTSWWASRRLRQAEEECCDAGVVASLPDGAASYATALVRSLSFVTETRSPCPALSSGLGPVTLLKRRLIMLHTNVERRLGLRSWFMVLAVAALALPIGITWAQDETSDASPVTRDVQAAHNDEQPDRLPPVQATAPSAPLLPAQPVPPSGTVMSGGYTSYVPYAPQGVAAPGQPPAYPGAGMYGMDQESRSAAEMAVRQAELELKARRIKARQAQNAIRGADADLEQKKKMVKDGAISAAELDVARSKVEGAKDEFELAQVEVERAELAVEQAKRRMSNNYRMPSNNYPLSTPGGAAAPSMAPPGMGNPGSMPPMAPGGGFGALPNRGGTPPLATTPAPSRRGSGSAEGGGEHRPAGEGLPTPSARSGIPGAIGGNTAPGSAGFGGGLGGGAGGSGGASAGMGSSPFGRGTMGGGMGMARSSDPFFRNFDRRGTGKIERNDVPEWMRERFFEIVDTNKDGVVDESEFNANYSKLWETGRGAGGATRTAGGRSSLPGESRPARDPRDERIKQLEEELKELRKTLDSMKKPVNEGATR